MSHNYVNKLIKPLKYSQNSGRLALLGLALLLFVSGCSRNETQYNQPPQQSRVPTTRLPEVTRPAVKAVPQRPRPVVATMNNTARPVPQVARPVYRPKPVVKSKPKRPAVSISRYSDKPKQTVITQKEASAVLTPAEIQNSTPPAPVKSERDPFDDVPDSADQQSENNTSPAVKSLMMRARADVALGNEQSAISKLERALRIDSSNATVWYLLAKAHQSAGEHQQAISMAKKALNYAAADEKLAGDSWKLIKQSGEASGDMDVVKEANNYAKATP